MRSTTLPSRQGVRLTNGRTVRAPSDVQPSRRTSSSERRQRCSSPVGLEHERRIGRGPVGPQQFLVALDQDRARCGQCPDLRPLPVGTDAGARSSCRRPHAPDRAAYWPHCSAPASGRRFAAGRTQNNRQRRTRHGARAASCNGRRHRRVCAARVCEPIKRVGFQLNRHGPPPKAHVAAPIGQSAFSARLSVAVPGTGLSLPGVAPRIEHRVPPRKTDRSPRCAATASRGSTSPAER